MIKKVISIREILVMFAIGVIAVIVGTFLDWQISSPLFPMEDNLLNGITASLGSVITSIVAVFACTIMVIKPPKQIGFRIFSIAAGAITGLGAIWGNINNVLDMHKYAPVGGIGLEIALITIGVICDIIPVILAFLAVKVMDSEKLFKISFVIFIIFAAAFLTQTAFKYLASRPRPRACFLDGYRPAKHGFRNWYEWAPFNCLSREIPDYYKSFFSGHTITSVILGALLPISTLYFKKTENNKVLQIILFYAGVLYTILIATSRILAGAHWLSDVGFGFIFGAAIIFIVQWIMARQPEKEVAHEKQNS